MSRRVTVQRVRLWSGLVLGAYVITHLVNHAAGLLSLAAAGRTLDVLAAVWQSAPGTLLLYGGFAVHVALAFWMILQRRSLAMPFGEGVRVLAALLIPPLLFIHIVGSRLVESRFGTDVGYPYMLAIYFELAPVFGWRQVAILLLAWLHFCLGLHYWLRFRSWYASAAPWLLALAVLLPAASLAGTLTAGRELQALFADPAWAEQRRALVDQINHPAKLAFIGPVERWLIDGYFGLLAAALLGRLVRRLWEWRGGRVAVTYPDGRRVMLARGASILEASRTAGIPHTALCGGRGRCSTCRVRVGQGLSRLPPPAEGEAGVLARIGAAPNVRLACQTRPTSDVSVMPLVPPFVGADEVRRNRMLPRGREQELVILFADLRDFTRFAERRLPFDVVFLLNRYFQAMGEAVEGEGGRVDKFIGDGVMALFGLEGGVTAGCRSALLAARGMSERLAVLNGSLAAELDGPLRLGIGVHRGPVIVGEMGWGRTTSLTAIGDAVNTASRLEAATKEFRAELVVSEEVAELAGVDFGEHRRHEVVVRGRETPLGVRVVASASRLSVKK